MSKFSRDRVKGFLHTDGRKMVNENGETVVLRGWGVGSWMNPEGFMIGGVPLFAEVGGFNDFALPRRFERGRTMETTVRELAGTAYAKEFAKKWYRSYLSEEDIRLMADMGYNSVRLPVSARLFLAEEPEIQWIEEGFAVLDPAVEEPMKAAIRAAGADGDSVGGLLETAILGLPAGIGEPYFDSVESKIAHLAFSIPAVKGIEFGTGFDFAGLRGSEANDAFRMTPEGAVVTASNHNAGINGGIANGMPVVFRTVVKPTPSIYKQQDTVDYLAKKNAELSIQGRHDPCIVPRAAIVQTCAAALAVADLLTARYGEAWMTHPTSFRKEDD